MLLVTGATGYLGAALVELLVSQGLPVRIDDAQARALGFRPRGLDVGLPRTVAWLRTFDA